MVQEALFEDMYVRVVGVGCMSGLRGGGLFLSYSLVSGFFWVEGCRCSFRGTKEPFFSTPATACYDSEPNKVEKATRGEDHDRVRGFVVFFLFLFL